jgi:hypothetical protein
MYFKPKDVFWLVNYKPTYRDNKLVANLRDQFK